MLRLAFFASCLLAFSSARYAYQFADQVEFLLSAPLQTTFTCVGRIYGFYADVDNNCEVFHVCNPVLDDDHNEIEMDHWSFVCGNQTVFSQDTLSCNHKEEAFPCEEAPGLYDVVNSEFGRVLDEKKRK